MNAESNISAADDFRRAVPGCAGHSKRRAIDGGLGTTGDALGHFDATLDFAGKPRAPAYHQKRFAAWDSRRWRWRPPVLHALAAPRELPARMDIRRTPLGGGRPGRWPKRISRV